MHYSIKHTYSAVLMALAVLLIATTSIVLGQGPGAGPRSMMRGPVYDVSNEMTVEGTVSEVQQFTGMSAVTASGVNWANCPRGRAGIHVSVLTDQGKNIIVHVAPATFLATKNFMLTKGDKVRILGSTIQYRGSDFLIAKEITKGNETLTLRDSQGVPLWAGPRR